MPLYLNRINLMVSLDVRYIVFRRTFMFCLAAHILLVTILFDLFLLCYFNFVFYGVSICLLQRLIEW